MVMSNFDMPRIPRPELYGSPDIFRDNRWRGDLPANLPFPRPGNVRPNLRRLSPFMRRRPNPGGPPTTPWWTPRRENPFNRRPSLPPLGIGMLPRNIRTLPMPMPGPMPDFPLYDLYDAGPAQTPSPFMNFLRSRGG